MSTQSRQLAVIMFTDNVGYTAFMQADEQKELYILKKNRGVASTNIVTTDFNPLNRSTGVRVRTVSSEHLELIKYFM